MSVGAVQEFLYKAVRAAAESPGGSPRIVIEIDFEADEMEGCILPAMGDRVTSIIHLDGFGCEQATIAQFIEEWQQPAFSCQRGGG